MEGSPSVAMWKGPMVWPCRRAPSVAMLNGPLVFSCGRVLWKLVCNIPCLLVVVQVPRCLGSHSKNMKNFYAFHFVS